MDLLVEARRVEMGELMNSDATNPVPYDWEKDREIRLSKATPQDTVRGLFANGILDVVRNLAGDEAARRCLDATGLPKFMDIFNYPIAPHLELVFAGARMLAPRFGSVEEALRQLGRRSTGDFLGSAAGKTMKLLARGEPKRLVETLPTAYRVSMTFGAQKIEWTGPTSGRYTLKRDFIPVPCHEGVLTALIETAKVGNVKVHGWSTGPLDSEYVFSWS